MYGRKHFFQAAIVIFLVGSALSGVSTSMAMLIAFRALQGIGGGGVMIGAQTIIGDVVSPRNRGRYQGLFGAVFGVTSVLGPLLGGLIVDNLSWHWIFYINLPLGAVALAITAAVLPSTLTRVHHVIDYLGAALIALAATSFVLLTSLGGTTYKWDSLPIVILGVAGAGLTILFVLAESRAVEPVIPLKLFANRVFSAASAIGFVVGFAMFGAISFLPLYLQVVKDVNPTVSGVRLLPLMAGLLLTSTGSGLLITRTGRYKIFPVVGTGLMTLGLYLLSGLDASTGVVASSAYMFVLGAGLGGVMQVLVIAVQNAVDYQDLGAATSGATFFRSMGGSFGVAVFGAIFANELVGNLKRYLRGLNVPAGLSSAGINPQALSKLPPTVHTGFAQAYAHSLQTVFLVAVPIGAVAFGLTWLLPERGLRKTTQAVDPGDTYALPKHRTSLQELERSLTVLTSREHRRELFGRLNARAGLRIDPVESWLLLLIDRHPDWDTARLGRERSVGAERVTKLIRRATDERLITVTDGDERILHGRPRLTPAGRHAVERLLAARRQGLNDLLDGWSPEEHDELCQLVDRLTRELLDDEPAPDDGAPPPAPAAAAGAA
jgi:EmrB/QacA subfamily drug resistance transporter